MTDRNVASNRGHFDDNTPLREKLYSAPLNAASDFFTELAQFSRISTKDRLNRLRRHLLPIAQSGLAAAIAWLIAHNIVGHPQPFFAPIAAVIVLGIAVGQRLRRAIELTIGVTVGIGVGDILIYFIGTGALQVGLVVSLAISVALLVGGGALLVAQAGSSAILVATLAPPSGGIYYTRWIDALIGGAVGFTVGTILLPFNPVRAVKRAAAPLFDGTRDALDAVADALEAGDKRGARLALSAVRKLDEPRATFREVVKSGQEHASIAPVWWRRRDQLGNYLTASVHIGRAITNCEVLARRAYSLLRTGEKVPTQLIIAVRNLARAVELLHKDLFTDVELAPAQALLLTAVHDTEAITDIGFSGRVVLGQ
ncbi:MAG: aromatic acid exporter family protein, partial [Corynebacteriales bacterium]|nr:aromatic acid exporter family protein [Mycobacteriales bacterium]